MSEENINKSLAELDLNNKGDGRKIEDSEGLHHDGQDAYATASTTQTVEYSVIMISVEKGFGSDHNLSGKFTLATKDNTPPLQRDLVLQLPEELLQQINNHSDDHEIVSFHQFVPFYYSDIEDDDGVVVIGPQPELVIDTETGGYKLSTIASLGSLNEFEVSASTASHAKLDENEIESSSVINEQSTLSERAQDTIDDEEEVNTAPIVTSEIGPQTATENVSFSYDTSFNFLDVDLGDELLFSMSGPDWLNIDPITGQIYGTPGDYDVGSFTITVTVDDGRGGVTSSSFDLNVANVNDEPVVNSVNINMTEDTPFIVTQAQLLAQATDIDSDNLTVTSVSNFDHGTIVDNGDGTWTLTPDENYFGPASIVFIVDDGDGGVVQSTAYINIEDTIEPSTLQISFNNQNANVPNWASGNTVMLEPTEEYGNISQIDASTLFSGEGGYTIDVLQNDERSVAIEQSNAEGIRNIQVQSSEQGNVDIAEFKRADVELGDGGDSSVTLTNVQRGSITTGGGDDTIDIDAKSFDGGNANKNTFDIDTGDGSDTVTLTGDDSRSVFNVQTGSGDDAVTLDGDSKSAQFDLGTGDDTLTVSGNVASGIYVDAGGGDDTIIGSSADDEIIAGTGSDTVYGGQGDDIFTFSISEVIANETDWVHGGAGDKDILKVQFASSDSWTLNIDGDMNVYTSDDGDKIFKNLEDASGTFVFENGYELHFTGIDKIDTF